MKNTVALSQMQFFRGTFLVYRTSRSNEELSQDLF